MTMALAARWQDTALDPATRVDALLAEMTLEEKAAQLCAVWDGAAVDGGGVAPHQSDMEPPLTLDELAAAGVGQITRAFGTAPIDPALGAARLVRMQQAIVSRSRLGIPALAHEECLSGFTTWKATAYPVPLSWGATFDPALIHRAARRIGDDLQKVGVHQGLAPVLDVTRDPRWGRTEETIGEDPYLVGTVGAAYVAGLEDAGVVATLKHFVGYSMSRAARNLAPVSAGPREIADVLLPPFEMALREGGARSVMQSYCDIDGVPAAASRRLLTDTLRTSWRFEGTVVADYFAIGFLKVLHGVAETWGDAARLALTAGIDVELPAATAYRGPLVEEVRAGRIDETFVDRAVRRVLAQKLELGLLDADWSAVPEILRDRDLDDAAALEGTLDLDTAEGRDIARLIAERAVVLLENSGILPLDAGSTESVALIGPSVTEPMVMMGCYAFPNHVGIHHPELPIGIGLATLEESVRAEFPRLDLTVTEGTGFQRGDSAGIAAAVAAARAAEIAVVAVGDRSALFGHGTSGEGCDAEDLALPGRQGDLLEAVLDTGTPTIVVVISGRPYALGTAPERAAAILQAFLPGEEGGSAITGVLSGRVRPSGRLPVSIPRTPGAQPTTYLGAPLAQRSDVSVIDPTPRYPFGYGCGYEEPEWAERAPALARVPLDGTMSVDAELRNPGHTPVVDVVQVYLHDPVAAVVRPVQRLVGYERIVVPAESSVRVRIDVPTDAAAFSDGEGGFVLEPGAIELRVGASSSDIRATHPFVLMGDERRLGHDRRLLATTTVDAPVPLGGA